MESLFRISFRIFGRKQIFFKGIAGQEYWSKLQCIIYQWIRLEKVYKQMESFFKFQIHFQN